MWSRSPRSPVIKSCACCSDTLTSKPRTSSHAWGDAEHEVLEGPRSSEGDAGSLPGDERSALATKDVRQIDFLLARAAPRHWLSSHTCSSAATWGWSVKFRLSASPRLLLSPLKPISFIIDPDRTVRPFAALRAAKMLSIRVLAYRVSLQSLSQTAVGLATGPLVAGAALLAGDTGALLAAGAGMTTPSEARKVALSAALAAFHARIRALIGLAGVLTPAARMASVAFLKSPARKRA